MVYEYGVMSHQKKPTGGRNSFVIVCNKQFQIFITNISAKPSGERAVSEEKEVETADETANDVEDEQTEINDEEEQQDADEEKDEGEAEDEDMMNLIIRVIYNLL